MWNPVQPGQELYSYHGLHGELCCVRMFTYYHHYYYHHHYQDHDDDDDPSWNINWTAFYFHDMWPCNITGWTYPCTV